MSTTLLRTMAGPERLPLTDDPDVLSILRIHHALWNKEDTIERFGQKYIPHVPEHKGYSSVILPNSVGHNLLWITQNLNKSTAGTLSINKASSLGYLMRITWIVDNDSSKFVYKGCVNTTLYCDDAEDIIIEHYHDYGTQVFWTNMPFHVPVKSKY